MQVKEKSITVPITQGDGNIIEFIKSGLGFHLGKDELPIRFVVTESNSHHYQCEIGVVSNMPSELNDPAFDILKLRRREFQNTKQFNAVLLIPTGIGAEIGGHAGDATAVAKLFADSCDNLILHPNVVNASDINEMPDNSLYVEGSIIDRLLLGTVGLQASRTNRILVVLDDHPDVHFTNAAINSVSAARAISGLSCPEVICLNPPIQMYSDYSKSGRAAGRIENLSHCLEALSSRRGEFDAVAISSVIRVPTEYHIKYFEQEGKMVNPWGGVEAMLTHTLSLLLGVPTAHSPMFESKKIENIEAGIVDPRMSAEAVSMTFLQCILKGLQKAPKIIRDEALFDRSEVLSVEDISCLVIPDGCLGLPVLAALEQGITVITVRENKNLMRNDLTSLPWSDGQLIQVGNYLEAAGVMNALKAGITVDSVRRPFKQTKVTNTREGGCKLLVDESA